jgi:hypothetical protein
MKKKLLSLILLFEISVVKADTIDISSAMERSHVVFTENKGQISDQNYHSRPDVLFSGSDGKIVYHIRNK